jgi:cell division protein ZapA
VASERPGATDMKQMEVTILGQSYILACPDGGEAALLAAVAQVDSEMSAIRDAGKVKARERMAVLAALNLAYQLADRPVSRVAPAQRKPAPAAAQDAAADDVQIDTLIARIDSAMGSDGHLL